MALTTHQNSHADVGQGTDMTNEQTAYGTGAHNTNPLDFPHWYSNLQIVAAVPGRLGDKTLDKDE
jgi:hypothetical protein